ncbi:hypothetical protein SLNSH_16985 [Alsobacter soli]|uniref:Uncharacterized protein n=1 Tax=Alsobacter soli TaxID=2109933 RepID=A0A2T1HQ69_9HYPH|nr:hypothetical protein SLNSH_16985 [Alsobacter soli]
MAGLGRSEEALGGVHHAGGLIAFGRLGYVLGMFPDMTIAGLERDGISHAEFRCCGVTVMAPWALLRARPDEEFEDVAARARCSRCGRKPDDVRPWGQWMAVGFVVPRGRGATAPLSRRQGPKQPGRSSST